MQSCAHVRHVAQASRKRGRVNYIHGTVCCHPERRASTVRYIATQLTGVLPLVSLTAPAAAPHRHPQPRPQLPKGARRDPSVILLVPLGPRPLSKPNPEQPCAPPHPRPRYRWRRPRERDTRARDGEPGQREHIGSGTYRKMGARRDPPAGSCQLQL